MDTEEFREAPAEIASRFDDLVAEISEEVEAILRDLSRLHREDLDLRARQRLKRAELGVRRIAAVLRQVAEGDPTPEVVSSPDAETERQPAG